MPPAGTASSLDRGLRSSDRPYSTCRGGNECDWHSWRKAMIRYLTHLSLVVLWGGRQTPGPIAGLTSNAWNRTRSKKRRANARLLKKLMCRTRARRAGPHGGFVDRDGRENKTACAGRRIGRADRDRHRDQPVIRRPHGRGRRHAGQHGRRSVDLDHDRSRRRPA